jgi:hypothetical protein
MLDEPNLTRALRVLEDLEVHIFGLGNDGVVGGFEGFED